MPETPDALKLPVQPHNRVRMRKYDQIAQVHREIGEAVQRSQLASKPMSFDPILVLHCEQAVAFLAEEVLRLGALVETEMSVRKSVEAGD